MKIAVATENKQASAHFGHCEGFIIYEVDEGEIVKKSFTPNPGHRPGYLPVFLRELDIDVIIAGGMGISAQQIFNENGIEVVVGAEGASDNLVEKYIKGGLISTDSFCEH